MSGFSNALYESLERFAPVSPELLTSRALLRRTDTKFVLGPDALVRVLGELRDDYALLRTNEQPIADYDTLYYDEPEYTCLREHLRGRRPRFKVRIRHYVDRQLSYLEVKKKVASGQTHKTRRALAFRSDLDGSGRRFIDGAASLDGARVVPTLFTRFDRITLVGTRTMERATIDRHIRFATANQPDNERVLERVVIFEVKQARFMARSPLMLALRRARVRPLSISKYCTGQMLLQPLGRLSALYADRIRRMMAAA